MSFKESILAENTNSTNEVGTQADMTESNLDEVLTVEDYKEELKETYSLKERYYQARSAVTNRIQEIAHSVFASKKTYSVEEQQALYDNDPQIKMLEQNALEQGRDYNRSRLSTEISGYGYSQQEEDTAKSEVVFEEVNNHVDNMVALHMEWVSLHLEFQKTPEFKANGNTMTPEQVVILNSKINDINYLRAMVSAVYGVGDAHYHKRRAEVEKVMVQELATNYFNARTAEQRSNIASVMRSTLNYPAYELNTLLFTKDMSPEEKAAKAMEFNTQDRALSYLEKNPQMFRSTEVPDYEIIDNNS